MIKLEKCKDNYMQARKHTNQNKIINKSEEIIIIQNES